MIVAYLKHTVVPILVSVGLHGLLIVAMLKGWSAEPIKQEVKRPNYVQAKLIKLEAQVEPEKKAPPADKPKIVDLTQKRKELERQKRLEEQKRKQQAEQKKKAEAEAQRKKQEQARQAKEKAEAERKARELAEQKQEEQARRQREQAAFERALAQEQEQLLEESYAVAAQSYMSAISQRIEQNWSRPPSARNNMECELLIKLVPTGRVINVDVVKSSGNAQFDRSAVQAVQKAEQFPIVKEMKPEVFERYYRELNLVFKPQDLRQ